MNSQRVLPIASLVALVFGVLPSTTFAVRVPVNQDVMTSAFFQGTNLVRGYLGDNRPVFRVSSDNAFGVGPETIYLTFDPSQFDVLSKPAISATLTMESTDGQFGANAGPGNPFVVSAHAVDTDPLAAITDDTNPGGAISWFDFFNNNILPADLAAQTSVDGFGRVTFDVTSVVNDWIAGTNTVFALAMTGKNDSSGNDFLHGFLNNHDAGDPLGVSFLTVRVPEPSAALLFGCALLVGAVFSRNRKS